MGQKSPIAAIFTEAGEKFVYTISEPELKRVATQNDFATLLEALVSSYGADSDIVWTGEGYLETSRVRNYIDGMDQLGIWNQFRESYYGR